MQEAFKSLPDEQRSALEAAALRVRNYHERQKQESGCHSWEYTESDGTTLGQKVTPIDRVGLYVPGGKAAYPSSVLMNAIPAKVAGVQEVIMVVPPPDCDLRSLFSTEAEANCVPEPEPGVKSFAKPAIPALYFSALAVA